MLEFAGERLSYGELERRSNQLAHHLRRLGVGPEVLVGLCVERSLEMVVALLGILKAGGAYVPLDPSFPQGRLAYMVADSGLRVLVTHRQLDEKLGLGTESTPVWIRRVWTRCIWIRTGRRSARRRRRPRGCRWGAGRSGLRAVHVGFHRETRRVWRSRRER